MANHNKAVKISKKHLLGIQELSISDVNFILSEAKQFINLNKSIISKPKSREEALNILERLNGKKHELISSVCISRNGSMIWNYSDKAILEMKNFDIEYLKDYLSRITDKTLYSYNVYQIEGRGKELFKSINGDLTTVMGLPIIKIKDYLEKLQ